MNHVGTDGGLVFFVRDRISAKKLGGESTGMKILFFRVEAIIATSSEANSSVWLMNVEEEQLVGLKLLEISTLFFGDEANFIKEI